MRVRTGPLFYPCVLGYRGQVSLSLLPAGVRAPPKALRSHPRVAV